jgi:hypothetical protein
MKKFVFFLIMISMVVSCTLDDEPKSDSVALPIESVIIPSDWPLNQLGAIKVTYRRPTTCHLFNGFNYQYTDEFTRTVNIEAIKFNDDNCIDASAESYEVDLQFKPTEFGIYHFKFWSGVDENGNNTFLEYDIDVQ